MKIIAKYLTPFGFIAVVLLMLLLVYIALSQLQRFNQSLYELVEETNVKIQSANTMRDAIRLRGYGLSKMQLTDDYFERDDYHMKFLDYAGMYRIARENLLSHKTTEEEKILLGKINAKATIAQPYNDRSAEILLAKKQGKELEFVLSKAEENRDQILALLDELVEVENRHAKLALTSAYKHFSQTRYVMFFLTALALLMCAIVAWKNKKISYQATHDPLTNLLNRREFEHSVNTLLNRSRNDDSLHTLLFMDLDQFKAINDSCGHIAGDQLLCQVASKIVEKTRQSDTLARLGGDEFGLVLANCNIDQAKVVAEKIRKAIEELRFSWDDKIFRIGISIGISTISKDQPVLDEVVATADAACLTAKELGRNLVHVFDNDDGKLNEVRGQTQWITRINEALENDYFVLYFQPIVALAEKNAGKQYFEVLIRYQEPGGKLYAPGAFLPAAERYGKITEIDYWVIKNAFRWLKNNRDKHADTCLSINLSGVSLPNKNLMKFIKSHLKKNNINPQQIIFEVTETAAIASLDAATRLMSELKSIGIRFSLDDFGSGLSSFSYLKHLPVDILKIDGSFVRTIAENPIDLAMVKSINEIGHVMGMQTVAEFVENMEILDKLVELGVDYAQGYGISPPGPYASKIDIF